MERRGLGPALVLKRFREILVVHHCEPQSLRLGDLGSPYALRIAPAPVNLKVALIFSASNRHDYHFPGQYALNDVIDELLREFSQLLWVLDV